MKNKHLHQLLSCLIAISLLASCANKKEDTSAEFVYKVAMKELKDRNYSEATRKFEEINNNHPLSKWAVKGQIMTAYAHYKKDDYDDVIVTVNGFIQSNPSHKDINYMQYLRSMSYYERIPDIQRGQDNSQMASYSFRELIARYPDSIYAQDGLKKLPIIDEHLAGAKMSVGRYNIETKNYIGAINNFNEVINKYRMTQQVPEAYYRLAEIYKKLGMESESQKAVSIISQYYPKSVWNKRLKRLDKGNEI
ncbi:MAG: outer membrane protein assembly factor BamD [Proteobacteria bacterium]|nr:outer membrane protein assembly factor BamD [Pseudomonadota bacterium]